MKGIDYRSEYREHDIGCYVTTEHDEGIYGIVNACDSPIGFMLTHLPRWKAVAIVAILNAKEDV